MVSSAQQPGQPTAGAGAAPEGGSGGVELARLLLQAARQVPRVPVVRLALQNSR